MDLDIYLISKSFWNKKDALTGFFFPYIMSRLKLEPNVKALLHKFLEKAMATHSSILA